MPGSVHDDVPKDAKGSKGVKKRKRRNTDEGGDVDAKEEAEAVEEEV